MRLIGLLIVVAIIYIVISRRGPMNSTQQAMKEADAVMATPTPPGTYYPPTAQPAQPAATSSGLRAPLDRTRSVLGDVKKRNGAGEF